MVVLTKEGNSMKYGSHCADVSEALQAVGLLVAPEHAVCFGLGEEGQGHLTVHRYTGEVSTMRDDGIN